MSARRRRPFETAAILGFAAVSAVILGQMALLVGQSQRHPQGVVVGFFLAMATIVPAFLIGCVWSRVVGAKVQDRLEVFRRRYPDAEVFGVADQAEFPAALRSLGVNTRRRLVVGVLVCDHAGITLWRGFRQPRAVLHVAIQDILAVDQEQVLLGALQSKIRGLVTIRTPGEKVVLPLYFHSSGQLWFNIAKADEVNRHVRALQEALSVAPEK
ncbi:hypothetical protein [Leifsonia sp. 2MCAF36]|uniref:hypothetical protein n=1 Tax=Leifsonia sp. 2MCAF36 TaxID=3232988 RepID=UPI003F9DB510